MTPELTPDQITQNSEKAARHVAAEVKPLIDKALEAEQAGNVQAAADYKKIEEGVGRLKANEMTTDSEVAEDLKAVEHILTIDEVEPGSIVTFKHDEPDPTHDTQQKVMVLEVRDGAIDYIGIDRESPSFGVANTKKLNQVGLAPAVEANGKPSETDYDHTTGSGLRIPPKFHDKEEASNQLALLSRIDQTQQKYDAVPVQPPTDEGLATEALAHYTVEGKQAENFQQDLRQAGAASVAELPQAERPDEQLAA